MDIKIRNERISDFNSVANVNYEAFLGWHPDNQYVSEPILVDLLRHNSMFDPELSLVAEADEKVIGHVLFSPFRFIVSGEEQLGVVLAPVAVKPEFQHKGVGRLLIEEGHRKAKENGVAFSLLCGHVGYYPRFGYKTGMFSLSGANVSICPKSFDNEGYNDRPVNAQDIKWILNAWKSQHASDTLALLPGENISEWSNYGTQCRCSVVSKNSRKEGIKFLHPKEFELLVDLLFRQSGWRRVSILGESMKFIDLELEDPITHDLYMIQVKSESNKKEFEQYTKVFLEEYKSKYRKLYYVVHSPKGMPQYSENDAIEIILSKKLAEMIVDLGLLNWLLDRIK